MMKHWCNIGSPYFCTIIILSQEDKVSFFITYYLRKTKVVWIKLALLSQGNRIVKMHSWGKKSHQKRL